ncbi:MAG: MerR family transcriptional regulator, partial [Myxococcota bacterium]|nr:MerR family transcriptional regulator [Myxococcota bacterium]
MSNRAEKAVEELTYPLGAAARLTGISPDTLRAWERRYEVVVPLRTPGGTRRYTAADLERLGLVKAAIDGG